MTSCDDVAICPVEDEGAEDCQAIAYRPGKLAAAFEELRKAQEAEAERLWNEHGTVSK